MMVGAINPLSSTPALTRAAPIARIVEDGRPATSAKPRGPGQQRRSDPLAAATEPAAASSSQTRAALSELQLGG